MNNNIVVVGSGISAITAIKTIRSIDKTSRIHLLGEEKFYPYYRLKLSKSLLKALDETSLMIQKKDWYDENNINIYKEAKVKKVDTKNSYVVLENGEKIYYKKLLLANGAKNRRLNINGVDKVGVMNLRTLEDAMNIENTVKNMDCVLQLGGGILGLEMAYVLSRLGKKVILAEISKTIMPKNLDENASRILIKILKDNNIDIHMNTAISEILGDEKVKGVKTKSGATLHCDGVIYSVGAQPNIDILEDSGIETNIGIVVNNKMETNIEDIYASGDVAEFDGKLYGLWNIAMNKGKIAGYNMAGQEELYQQAVPITTLNAFDTSLFSMGIIDESKATNIIMEKDEDNNIYNKIIIRDNKVIGAIIIGDIKITPILKSAIENKKNIDGVDLNKVSVKSFIEILKK